MGVLSWIYAVVALMFFPQSSPEMTLITFLTLYKSAMFFFLIVTIVITIISLFGIDDDDGCSTVVGMCIYLIMHSVLYVMAGQMVSLVTLEGITNQPLFAIYLIFSILFSTF